MDFDLLDTSAGAEAGFKVQLEHPATGAPIEAWITVRGSDSATMREAGIALQRAVQKRLRNKRGAAAAYDPTLAEDDELNLLVAATVSWEGIAWEGKVRDCTPENVKYYYKRWDWARKQVERAIHSYENFLPASSKS